jgi:4-hydroxy-3-methylbut-2-enyl diphosphate reductase
MNILLAENAGFCFGVRRALEMAEAATREHERVYSLGPLIHNPQVVERLAAEGLVVCDDLADLPAGSVAMIRAHGAGPATFDLAGRRAVKLLDATCPFVGRVHLKAAQFAKQGYQVLVLGDPNHPEAQGIVAHTSGKAAIVQGPADLEGLTLAGRVAVVSQTTQTFESLQELVDALLPRVTELAVANTICDATTKRQAASLEVARRADAMVVIGGFHSANTRRLAEICAATGTPTFHVETAAELQPEWFAGAETVGVTAGASTPEAAIAEVLKRLEEIGEGPTC